MESVEICLLGRFEVSVDGKLVSPEAWTHGRARDLVKLLALAPGRRLPRERVVEELWPHLGLESGLANLHKAAHHGRRALGHGEAIVLREGHVMLAPQARVETDVERFEASGDSALYAGELLPEDRYAAWAQDRRSQLHARYVEALRAGGRWEELAECEPADEAAQREVMRERLAAGDRLGSLRAFERLRAALDELGLRPSVETLALHARIAGGAALETALAAVETALAEAPLAERAQLLATRADLLMSVGDRGAPVAYAEAAAAAGPEGMALRIRQAWAHLAAGDPGAAQATLAVVAPRSDAERVGHLLAVAAAAWFGGDVERARSAASEAEPLSITAGMAREARTAAQIQAMVAHSTGAWPDALRRSLEASLRAPDIADTLFDGHLCVAEYVLTSGDPHDRIRSIAEDLRANAVRTGARRAQTFASTVLGELALVAGRIAEAEERFREAVRLSRAISAVSAEALATLRLGEAVRVQGDVSGGDKLLADALVISRWSPLSAHLKPLAHAALLRVSDDRSLADQRLDDAEAELRAEDLLCAYCGMAFKVGAALAAARASQPDRAAAYLSNAEATAALWRGGPWPAALDEARAEIALARGDRKEGRTRLRAAHDAFAGLGWRLEADRIEARLSRDV